MNIRLRTIGRVSAIALFASWTSPSAAGQEVEGTVAVTHPVPEIERLALDLAKIGGPNSFTAAIHKANIRPGDDPRKLAIAEWVREVSARLSSGENVQFSEAAGVARRSFILPVDEREIEFSNRYYSEYRSNARDRLQVTELADGTVQADLELGDVALQYQSSFDWLIVGNRGGQRNPLFFLPEDLVYPLGVEAYHAEWLRSLRWNRSSLDRGTSTLLEANEGNEGASTVQFVFDVRGSFPALALRTFNRGNGAQPDREQTEIVSFFKQSPYFWRSGAALPFFEVITFDTLGMDGYVEVVHTTVLGCMPFSRRALLETESEALRLPILFTEKTRLQDNRPGAKMGAHGSDISAWPQEILDYLDPIE